MKDEMDILREAGSMAAGHGSIALSEILGRKINIELPSLNIVTTQEAMAKMQADRIVISVHCAILSGLQGEILFCLDEKCAFKVIDICYRLSKADKQSGLLTEMGVSLIKEVGNVIISSYVGALSVLLKTPIVPSIPTMVSGSISQIMNMVISSYNNAEYISLIEVFFEEKSEHITGVFYLILSPDAMKGVMDACKRTLKELE